MEIVIIRRNQFLRIIRYPAEQFRRIIRYPAEPVPPDYSLSGGTSSGGSAGGFRRIICYPAEPFLSGVITSLPIRYGYVMHRDP